MENKVKIQSELLQELIKKTIIRIKHYKEILIKQKKERSELGGYEDCGSFYAEEVLKTEAIISELISQKIMLQKWRKAIIQNQLKN